MDQADIQPSCRDEGRSAAEADWSAGTVKTRQEVSGDHGPVYVNAYFAVIDEQKAGQAWRAATNQRQ